MIDEWFPLSSHVPLKGIEPGSLRVRARYSVEKIMPEEEYSEFKEVDRLLLYTLFSATMFFVFFAAEITGLNSVVPPRR